MNIFRIALAAMGLGLAIYTGFVMAAQGPNFLPFYFTDLFSLTWPGQFDLDFTILIVLAATWILWRNRCDRPSIVLAVLLVPLVSMLLTGYLLYLSWKERGDVVRMLIGDRKEAF